MSLVYRGFIHPLLPGGLKSAGLRMWPCRPGAAPACAGPDGRGPDAENMVRMPGRLSRLFAVNIGVWVCGGEQHWGELEAWDVSLVEGGPGGVFI